MNKSDVKNLAAAGIVILGIVGTWKAATGEDTPPPDQPELGLDYSDKSLQELPPLIGGPEFIPAPPRLHDHNGREVTPFRTPDAPPAFPGAGNLFPFQPSAAPYAFLMVPEKLRPLFSGAAIGNWNALKFAADGSKIEGVGVYVTLSNLDCNAGKAVLKDYMDKAPEFTLNPELREELETVAGELFLKGELEYLSLGLKRGELPHGADEVDEDTKKRLLAIQDTIWKAEWPDSLDLKVTLQCRPDTFGRDM